jgi:hypothetical protein
MTASEKAILMIRNTATHEVAHLVQEPACDHPPWVHRQLGTKSENELAALTDGLRLADYLLGDGRSEDARGIFVDVPNGALAWKLRDPFQGARWLFDDSEVVEALELDPELVLRVRGAGET